MSLEIRPYRPEEQDAFYRVPAIVFGNYASQAPARTEAAMVPPEWSLCAFEDGELATTYAAYPFTIRLNGAPARAAGVTFVGTLPWFRRRGHLRKITEADFRRRYEERLEPIAILTASIAGIYHRYGYAITAHRDRFSIDPRWINFAPSLPRAEGTWREISADDPQIIKDLYKKFATPRNGYIHRGQVMWSAGALGLLPGFGPDFGKGILAVYEEAGVPQGYVTYSAKWFDRHVFDDAGEGQRVFVRDYAWLTPAAYRAIWQHLKTFDLAIRIQMFAPVDDPARDVLLDPRELHAQRGDWILGRVIDVERALALRPYGTAGRVTFEVRDSFCPWNDGRWALEAGPEGAAVSRTNDAPQLTMDISGLALLLFGTIAPAHAVRIGRADAAPDAPLDLWDAMWRTHYAPYCADGF
jgi:predicted acetyltransferase